MSIELSIIIPTHKRWTELHKCLVSIFGAQMNYQYEILICVNGQDEETLPLIQKFFPGKQQLQVFSIRPQNAALARNYCVNRASGRFLCFLDDDIQVEPFYFSLALTTLHFHPELDILGGPDRLIRNPSLLDRTLDMCLQNFLIAGKNCFRHLNTAKTIFRKAGEKDLILCNLWIKRSSLKNSQLRFHPELKRNEENLLLYEAKNFKLNIFYLSSLFVYHQRRSQLTEISKTFFKSGFTKLKLFRLAPQFTEIYYFAPLVVSSLFVLAPFFPFFAKIYTLFLLLTLACSFSMAWKKRNLLCLLGIIPLGQLIMVSYCAGMLWQFSLWPRIWLEKLGVQRTLEENLEPSE